MYSLCLKKQTHLKTSSPCTNILALSAHPTAQRCSWAVPRFTLCCISPPQRSPGGFRSWLQEIFKGCSADRRRDPRPPSVRLCAGASRCVAAAAGSWLGAVDRYTSATSTGELLTVLRVLRIYFVLISFGSFFTPCLVPAVRELKNAVKLRLGDVGWGCGVPWGVLPWSAFSCGVRGEGRKEGVPS